MDIDRGVGIREVAAHAGVSDSTVSNVINRPEIVSAKTIDRVHRAMAELGFVRNAVARHLRLGASNTLGMIVADIANPFFAELAHECDRTAERDRFTMLLSSSDGSPAREERTVRMFEEQRIRGLLIAPVADETESMRSLAGRGMPLVLLGVRGDTERVCSVVVDERAGGQLAARRLIEAGRRDLVFVGSDRAPVRQRWEGASSVAAQAGSSIEWVTTPDQGFDDGVSAARALLGRETLPDGIFAANDSVALGILNTLLGAGVAVPDRVAVVGYDDADVAHQAMVPLTTVRQPRLELAGHAIELVLDNVAEPARHAHRVVELMPTLVPRASA